MKRIERDFIALFNCLWHRDFPVSIDEPIASRSDWTIHLGLIVRQSATLLGARALFEFGGRTDAVLRYPGGEYLTFVEWEWVQAHSGINEFKKLKDRADQAVFQTFIGYTRLDTLQKTLSAIESEWSQCAKPLLAFIITYTVAGRKRCFESLDTYYFARGKYRRVRRQPALPWMVNRLNFISESD
ncbi:hypothetical protein ACYAE2_002304 [Pseudomonas aeruginosa]